MTAPRYSADQVAAMAAAIEQARAPKAAAPRASARAYAGAATGRLTSDWNPLNTSADSEILSSLRGLRARSRELIRDNEYALRAQRLVQNNVIGQGVGMQAQVANTRGRLQDGINQQIEDAWDRWCDKDRCHIGGTLAFVDIERMILGELFAAGEVLVRLVRTAVGTGNRVPLTLEIIEADRLIDQWSTARAPNGNAIRMGVEVDRYGRPQAYWLWPTHPGDYSFASFEPSRFVRVPAADMIHLYVQDRLPQTRGVPWMHAALKRLRDMGGYAEAEIVAARASASIMGFLETPDAQPADDTAADGAGIVDMEPGTIKQLASGQKFAGFAPTRPNAAMDPFMRLMLRGIASATGVSYESLSRDYSQSNYSSSRLALLDDRDLWRSLQSWYIRNFRAPLHRAWMEAATVAGQFAFGDYYTQRDRYEAVRFRPRGWSWVDPTREVAAYIAAVQAGFMTVGDVIALTGSGTDLEDVLKSRRAELDLMAENGLIFSTHAAPPKVGATPTSIINADQSAGVTDNAGDAGGPDAGGAGAQDSAQEAA